MTVLPTHVGTGTLVSGTGTITPAWPAGHQEGDLGLLFIESANNAAIATPAGWAPVGAGNVGTGAAGGTTSTRLAAFYRFARNNAEGDAAGFVADAGDHTSAVIYVVRGVHQGNPIHQVATSLATTQVTAVTFPAVTTTLANCYIVWGISRETNETIGAVSAGNTANVTERLDTSHASGNTGGIGIITATRATAGSTGTNTATLSATSVQERITIALRPKDDLDSRVLSSGWRAQNDDGSATNSQTITISAGSNRKLLVAVGFEASAEPIPTISTITCGGVNMTLVTDGVTSAASQSQIGFVAWYMLDEASLPANGSQTLTVTLSGVRQSYVSYVLLQNVQQGNVLDVTNTAETTTAATITAAMSFTRDNALVLSSSYYNGTNPQEHVTATVGGTAAPIILDWFVTGGGHVSTFCLGGVNTDNPSVVHTGTSNARRTLSAIALGPPANAATMALTGVPVEGSGTGSVDLGDLVVPEFVSISVGAARNIEITAGTTLLVLSVCRNDATGAGSSATLGGVGLNVANNSNDWTQQFYMLNPPEGIAAIAASGSNITNIIATQYTGVSEFVSSQQGSVLSHSFSPSRACLMTFSMAFAGGGTPLAGTEERFDTGGDYYGDRIESAGGTFSVGCSAGGFPDSTAALFLAPDSGDEPNSATMALVGVPVAGSGTGSARLTSTMALTGAPVAGSGTGSVRLTATMALTGAPVAGSGTGSARLTSTQALTGAPVAGSGTGDAKLTATQALTGAPVAGSGTAAARLTSTQALTGVPVAGAGTASARLTSTAALTGVPVAGSGTGSVRLTGTLSIVGVPVAGSGTGSAHLAATLALVGAPVEGDGTGQVIPVTTLALVGVPVQGSGTGEAKLVSTLALVGAAVAGSGTASALLASTLGLTGVPVAGSGTGSVRLTSTHALTGVPVAGSGTGAARLTATMELVGASIQGDGTGSVPSVAGLNLTGVPVQGSGTGDVRLLSNLQLSGVPMAGSGTASAKLTAQLNITGAPISGDGEGQVVQGGQLELVGVPVQGSGTGAAALQSALELLGVPAEGAGTGAARLTAALGLVGVPVTGSGAGTVALRATLNLTGARITGSGTGTRVNPFFDGVMDLVGCVVLGSGEGFITEPPKGDTQAQVGEDPSSASADLDAGHVQIGSAGTVVLVSQDNGVTVVITNGITGVKVG